MLKFFLISLLFCVNIFALSVSSHDNYKVLKNEKYNIIYTDDNINEVKFIQKNLDEFLKHNDNSFAYSFDEPLRLVLISNNIQIPNAFSTQVPYNLGIYFNGGSGMNDYFSTKSWLETLLIHEMVHNYQINAKKDKVSKTLHKYLGNNYMPIFFYWVPFFTLPNLYLPTPILEGNSVLNESIYNNGGRLHSGRHNALKNSLVLRGNINPTTFINDHLSYPYTTEKYIVGGFYMEYLAQKYGIDRINRFFYNHSIHNINPFMLNRSFLDNFGITFHQSVDDFVSYTQKKYKGYKELDNVKVITNSKEEIYLSKIDDKIYFITSDLTTKKELNIYDINTQKTIIKDTSLLNGKFFIQDDKYYTASHGFISSKKYKFALFNSEKYPIASTVGKDIQDIHGNKIAYIDIQKSFLNTKLYIDGEYYEDVASSAIFDKEGNIYYFKQNNKIRELYKNKTKVFEYDGFYGKIVDVVAEDIYFVANTKNGSGLYKYGNSGLKKLHDSENIIDAKIIADDLALGVTTTTKGYDVVVVPLAESDAQIAQYEVYTPKETFEFSYEFEDQKIQSTKYNELKELQYSMLYPSFGSSNGESVYGLNASFLDPIMFNMLNLYYYKNIDYKMGGASYTNERYIPFSVSLYNMDRDVEYTNERGYGGFVSVYGPLVKEGRNILYANLKYYMDDKNKKKNPTVASLEYSYIKGFALEDSPFLKSVTDILVKEDRDDFIYGIDYSLDKHISNEFYFNTNIKVLDSTIETLGNQQGIEIVDTGLETLFDRTNVLIEGVDFDFFAKDIKKASVGLSKTLHLSKYFYYFPASIRKESLFFNYNYYDITSLKNFQIKEQIVGVKLDVLLAHKFAYPVTVKYIKNDFSRDDYKIKFSLGVQF